MIKVAVLGTSGYGGAEILRILNAHDEVKLNYFGANTQSGQRIDKSLGHFYKHFDSIMDNKDLESVCEENDCILAATPHDFLAKILTKDMLKKCVIIDLSADFRLKNAKKYEEYYNFTHPNISLLQDSVYGLSELYRDSIKEANLIANPGCYPTCSTLCIAPFLKHGIIDKKSIIIDAKSGVSGAGRSTKLDNLFCEVHENVKAYGLINHRHTAEIEQNLSIISNSKIILSFTPHLIPMNRGILITAYAQLESKYESITEKELQEILTNFYANSYFIRVLEYGVAPQTRWVKGSNFVDVSVCLDKRNKRLIMMGALDNLVKGAAGQAIQNLNIRFGFIEHKALGQLPLFP